MVLETPKIMGILNVTPDSFSDGGQYASPEAALHRTEEMLKQGATIIDVGGYSSRPGAADVSASEELKRLAPVVSLVVKNFPEAIISVDTFRAHVAAEMLELGAHIINDVSGGVQDEAMHATVARYRAPYVLMHMQGTPQTMQQNPTYSDVVQEVWQYFVQQLTLARAAGIVDIVIDPGFGFGKTATHNYTLLRRLQYFTNLGCPLLVGLSRKSMLYKPLGLTATQVLPASSAAHAWALLNGAHVLRVHDVAEAAQVVRFVNLLQQTDTQAVNDPA